MWRFRLIILCLAHAQSCCDSVSSYILHTHTHTHLPLLGDSGSSYILNTPRRVATEVQHTSETRPSSYVSSTPPHSAIPVHHRSHLLNAPPTFKFSRTAACDPGPGRPAATPKKDTGKGYGPAGPWDQRPEGPRAPNQNQG